MVTCFEGDRNWTATTLQRTRKQTSEFSNLAKLERKLGGIRSTRHGCGRKKIRTTHVRSRARNPLSRVGS